MRSEQRPEGPVTVLVTERFPYGDGETFLTDEIEALYEQLGDVITYPIWPHPSSDRQRRHRADHPVPSAPPSALAAVAILVRALALPLIAGRLIVDGIRRREFRVLAVELAALLRGLRFALTAGGLPIQHVHAYWLSYPATCARTIARLLDVPWSATGHRYDLVQGLDLGAKALEVDAVRFVARTSQRLFEERVAVPPTRCAVIPLAQDVPPAPAAPEPTGPIVVCVPANLLPVKGHEYVIESVRILLDRGEEARLLVAGDGPRRAELRTLVDDLGLNDHISMPGRIDREHILDLYRGGGVTAVALPSLDLGAGVHEGLPIALVEAMGAGVPVVTTDSGGIPELVDEATGMRVPQRDARALADALERLHHDGDVRRAVVQEAHRRVRERFHPETVVPSLVELLSLGRVEVPG